MPLPNVPTRLLGREHDTAAVRRLLSYDCARLVTLMGPGGVGKTRLAIHVARMLAADFPDGAVFVSLDAAPEARHMLPAIAGRLGLREEGRQTVQQVLASYLRGRRMLLVLDNLEQIRGVAPVIAELLADAPGLTVLATSRESLRVYGEQEYLLEPLTTTSASQSFEAIASSPAVALFTERARAVDRTFTLNEANAHAVAEICARLDGLPLAIELAAARARLLPPRAILARLEHRLHVLTGGALDMPERQRTLRGAIDWSYDLLEGDEQRMFRRMAVFAGGCSIEAAEAVCVLDGEPRPDALEIIASLVNKSLVRQVGDPEHPRFGMLATIAEYAREKMEENDESERMGTAHADWFRRTFQAELSLGFFVSQRLDAMRAVTRELPDVRFALRWMREHGDAEGMLSLVLGMARYWVYHGSPTEGRKWIGEALALASDVPGDRIVPSTRAWALMHAGLLAYFQGDYQESITLTESARDILVACGLSEGVAYANANIGHSYRALGDTERALPLLHEALDAFVADGDRWGEGLCYQYLATYSLLNDLPDAAAWAERAVAVFTDLNESLHLIYAKGLLAHVHLWQDRVERAVELLHEMLPLATAWNDQRAMARVLKMCAEAAAIQKRYDDAVRFYRGALELLWERGDMWHAVHAIHGASAVVAELGRTDLGARLLGAADRDEHWYARPRTVAHLRLLERVRTTLTSTAFDAAYAEGGTMSLADAYRELMETLVALEASGPLTGAIRDAGAARSVAASDTSAAKTASVSTGANPPDGLTTREAEILAAIAGGHTDAQIAARLFISPRTVNAHVRSIYGKIGVSNRSAATRYALKHGLA